MNQQILTRDNSHLTRPTMGQSVPVAFQNLQLMSLDAVTAGVARFVNDSIAENTRKAYLSDLDAFERWGGSIPSSAETVAAYLAARADRLAVATLVRHLASISKAHEARGLPNPTRAELVRSYEAFGGPEAAPSARPSRCSAMTCC